MESEGSRLLNPNDLSVFNVKYKSKQFRNGRSHIEHFKPISHVQSTYDDSLINKTRVTNLSTNISQDDRENKLPDVSGYMSSKRSSILKNTRNQVDSFDQFRTTNHGKLNKIFKNNVIVNRKMIKTGSTNRKKVIRGTNKSVHWNSKATQDDELLEDSDYTKMNTTHNKRRSIGNPMDMSGFDLSNPLMSQTHNDSVYIDPFDTKNFGPKMGGMSVTLEVITQWVRDTLEDAEYFKIPGSIANKERKDILRRYGIDRESLMSQNISDKSITRLFRSLFIYSIGFNEMLQTMINQSKDKTGIMKCIWRVFSVLLEHC